MTQFYSRWLCSVLCLLILLGCTTLQPFDNRFYIYDWPSDIIDRWPLLYSHDTLAFNSSNKYNYGVGEVVNAEIGLYRTHQYSLFLTFYHRLLESPFRTLDPDNASVFFIPYDLGMDSSVRREDGALYRTDCPMMHRVSQLLLQSAYFSRNNGSDHFILHSINQMMTYFSHLKCLYLYEVCYNCYKLSIDKYPPRLYPQVLHRHPHLSHRWQSIPFPSNYHSSTIATASNRLPWRLSPVQMGKGRRFAIAYMGSLAVTAKIQRKLRKLLQAECLAHKSHCLLITLDSHDSLTATLNLPLSEEATTASLSPYLLSDFCLMPGGDFPTRKGFLDAMLSGCIPVTFQLYSAQKQWDWHWGSLQTALDCSLYIPRQMVFQSPRSIFKQLIALSANATFLQEKRRNIARVGDRMQYNLPGGFKLNEQTMKADANQAQYSFDAVDVVLERLLSQKIL